MMGKYLDSINVLRGSYKLYKKIFLRLPMQCTAHSLDFLIVDYLFSSQVILSSQTSGSSSESKCLSIEGLPDGFSNLVEFIKTKYVNPACSSGTHSFLLS